MAQMLFLEVDSHGELCVEFNAPLSQRGFEYKWQT
jgi:hypothetical protein